MLVSFVAGQTPSATLPSDSVPKGTTETSTKSFDESAHMFGYETPPALPLPSLSRPGAEREVRAAWLRCCKRERARDGQHGYAAVREKEQEMDSMATLLQERKSKRWAAWLRYCKGERARDGQHGYAAVREKEQEMGQHGYAAAREKEKEMGSMATLLQQRKSKRWDV